MFVNHSDISTDKKPNQVGYSEVQSEGYSGIYMCLKNPNTSQVKEDQLCLQCIIDSFKGNSNTMINSFS